MNNTIEIYPQFEAKYKLPLYYVEFNRQDVIAPLKWTLFKRQFINTSVADVSTLMTNEVHPLNLNGGIVNERFPNSADLNTKQFLMFMVDALNEKVFNNSH